MLQQLLRWILIPPAAVAAWYVALFSGFALHQGFEALCPASQVESGHCFAPWFLHVLAGLIVFGAALAAVLIMITCTLLAPTRRRQVAVVTFILGALAAIKMGFITGALGATSAAIIAGAIVLVVLLRKGV